MNGKMMMSNGGRRKESCEKAERGNMKCGNSIYSKTKFFGHVLVT